MEGARAHAMFGVVLSNVQPCPNAVFMPEILLMRAIFRFVELFVREFSSQSGTERQNLAAFHGQQIALESNFRFVIINFGVCCVCSDVKKVVMSDVKEVVIVARIFCYALITSNLSLGGKK